MKFESLLCTALSIYNGSWHFAANTPAFYNPWKECPVISSGNGTVVKELKAKYTCFNQPFRTASYLPSNCKILTVVESMHSILQDNGSKKIVFVGDSLTRQLYFAALCTLEFHKIPSSTIDYIPEIVLRDDYPCHDICIGNSTVLEYFRGSLFDRCKACPDGIRRPYNSSNILWLRKITSNTAYIVLNTGAWYNVFKDVGGPEEYNTTLHRVGQACEGFHTSSGILCLWLSMPPVPVNHTEPSIHPYHPDWPNYPPRNQWAKHILSQYGVIYIDIETLLMQRKVMNPNITADGLHWW